MDDLTEKCIKLRAEIIVSEFDYETRRKEHPHECPCNSSGPCHKLEELNCFFCFCPWYESEKTEGGCKAGNPLGKGHYFEREGHSTSDRIWDCSDCTYPHQKEVVKQYLIRFLSGELNP
jgi:Zn-finger protein